MAVGFFLQKPEAQGTLQRDEPKGFFDCHQIIENWILAPDLKTGNTFFNRDGWSSHKFFDWKRLILEVENNKLFDHGANENYKTILEKCL